MVGGVATAVTICAATKGLATITLLGTPLDDQSAALSPLMEVTGRSWTQLPRPPGDLPAVRAGSKTDVGDKGGKRLPLPVQRGDRGGAVLGGDDRKAGVFQRRLQKMPDRGIVLDKQQDRRRRGHGVNSDAARVHRKPPAAADPNASAGVSPPRREGNGGP